MKKILLGLTIIYSTYTTQAQDLIKNIPANAAAVVTIKGKNLTDLLSIKEFENSKIGRELVKELTRSTNGQITSINNIGINFNSSAHYFLEADKGVFSNHFIVPLKNRQSFEKLLATEEREWKKLKKEGAISYIQDEYDSAIVGWNDEMLVAIFTEISDNDLSYYGNSEVAVKEAIDAVQDATETVVESTEKAAESANNYKKRQEQYEKERKEREERYEKERQERKAKRDANKKKTAVLNLKKLKAVLNGEYTANNILKNKSYTSSLGKQTFEAHAWVGDFLNIYENTFLNGLYSSTNGMYNIDELYRGSSVSSTLDFKRDNAVLNVNFTMSDVMAKHTKAMYDGKLNKKFFKYFNEDKMLGYMSVNASTEGLLTEYPALMKSMFTNSTNDEMAEIIPVGADLLSVFLDEKAIGELVRGDMLFVVNDITKKQVNYTAYDYDDNYNRISVEKTKEETVPDFIFMATSNGKDIFSRIMNIGVNAKEVTLENDVYTFNTPKSVPVNIHAMHKNDVLFFATSKAQLLDIKNGSFKGNVSRDVKKSIRKNTSAAYINGGKLISQIPVEELPREFKEKTDFLANNIGSMLLTSSKIKGNISRSKVVLNTSKEGNKNSLVYFINFIDAFLD